MQDAVRSQIILWRNLMEFASTRNPELFMSICNQNPDARAARSRRICDGIRRWLHEAVSCDEDACMHHLSASMNDSHARAQAHRWHCVTLKPSDRKRSIEQILHADDASCEQHARQHARSLIYCTERVQRSLADTANNNANSRPVGRLSLR